MTKAISILVLIILSILAVFFLPEVRIVLHWIADAHQFLLDKLALLIHGDHTAKIVRLTLALVLVPLIIALIPAFIYWLFKRRMMPNYMAVVWVIWFGLVTILAY